MLQRRIDQLAVWLAGQPDNEGLLRVPHGGFVVQLRTMPTNKGFLAEFGGQSDLPLTAAANLFGESVDCQSLKDVVFDHHV